MFPVTKWNSTVSGSWKIRELLPLCVCVAWIRHGEARAERPVEKARNTRASPRWKKSARHWLHSPILLDQSSFPCLRLIYRASNVGVCGRFFSRVASDSYNGYTKENRIRSGDRIERLANTFGPLKCFWGSRESRHFARSRSSWRDFVSQINLEKAANLIIKYSSISENIESYFII